MKNNFGSLKYLQKFSPIQHVILSLTLNDLTEKFINFEVLISERKKAANGRQMEQVKCFSM
jgi:hypothetical protein